MSPISPRLVRGGIVLLDPKSAAVLKVLPLQYNPDTLSRTLQSQGVDSSGGGTRSEALRVKGPAVETLSLEAVFDATDDLERGDRTAQRVGVHPQLAALEMLLHPPSRRLQSNHELAQSGTLEIIPIEQPLSLFIWSENRILPVRITDFSVTEEAFDTSLNPIRARVSLGMRVLSVDDLGFEHKGGGLYMTYLRGKERLADMASGQLDALGLERIP